AIKMREIVLPGTAISDKRLSAENTYFDGAKTRSEVVGLYDSAHNEVIQLEGRWKPRPGDVVVGIVERVGRNGVYGISLTEAVDGLLIQDKYDNARFAVGDVIEAEIRDIEHKRLAVLERPKLLRAGSLMQIKAVRVPRLIGKANTMITQIIELTGCNIIVGRNGLVWMRGSNVAAATAAVLTVEREAHTSGLTERIKSMLEKMNGNESRT
ncbi:MAG: KH domain-containing protein, partial [Candidatus Marsarchaeota archaeon]|nr:KH domain-containing protein [Candidatus Marsarchaeota archaeon]